MRAAREAGIRRGSEIAFCASVAARTIHDTRRVYPDRQRGSSVAVPITWKATSSFTQLHRCPAVTVTKFVRESLTGP
jgi:hypothetical protein